MNEVVKTLMEYNLPREVAEKIDQINKNAYMETRATLEKASAFALGVRISPHSYIRPWDGTYQPPKLPGELLAILISIYKHGRLRWPSNPHDYYDEYTSTFSAHRNPWERFDKKWDDIYNLKLRSAMMNEGQCFYCKKPLQVDTSVYNNWQSYEDRRGYHKDCKNYISPCKR